MPSTVEPTLTTEEIDDLIYYARTGDLTALRSTITELSNSHSSAADQILNAAINWEDDGSESGLGCCLIHWPAANGNEQILSYLLSLLGSKQDQDEGTVKNTSGLVNHKNQSGNTPLHWAAVNGNISCVRALVAAGADPAMTNNAGHDALIEADRSGKEGGREVAEWISAHFAGLEKGTNGSAEEVETIAEDMGEADDVVMGDG